MKAEEIRLLRADEIECRVSIINEKGLSLLLFKDARVDQRILDETFTPFGWKRTHQSIDGNLYCTVEVWDSQKQQWIAKQDVGTMGYSEKEKSQASDSFKRACFNWGVGRELYTAPFIWIPAALVSIQRKGERFTTTERFFVKKIMYSERREIISLVIVNGKGKNMYELKPETSNTGEEAANLLTADQMQAIRKELERTGVGMKTVLDRYHIQSPEEMTPEIYKSALNSLRKTKPREAA